HAALAEDAPLLVAVGERAVSGAGEVRHEARAPRAAEAAGRSHRRGESARRGERRAELLAARSGRREEDGRVGGLGVHGAKLPLFLEGSLRSWLVGEAMTQDASALAPGSVVGEWTLLRKLGEGAMGVVFEARSKSGVTSALKIVRPELLARPDHAARFKREGKLLQRVEHRNVVRLIDVGEAGGFPYLALGFIEGESP